MIGGRITFEIFDGLNSKAEASTQKHREAAYGQEATQKQEEVEVLFRKLQHELTRHDIIHLIERNLSEGRRYFSLSTEEYERGVKNSRDMLASLQRYLEQETGHSRALMDYLIVKSELLEVLGR